MIDTLSKYANNIATEITTGEYSLISAAAKNMVAYSDYEENDDNPSDPSFDQEDFAYECICRGVEDFTEDVVSNTYDKLYEINVMGEAELEEHITKTPEDYWAIFEPSDHITEIHKVITEL